MHCGLEGEEQCSENGYVASSDLWMLTSVGFCKVKVAGKLMSPETWPLPVLPFSRQLSHRPVLMATRLKTKEKIGKEKSKYVL